ncbi:MAG: hypothetical protein ABIT08_00560 [Bacteroidia bacterium]
MSRLMLPVRFADKCELLTNVKSKDGADGVSSIIRPTMTDEGISLSTDNTAVTNAKAKQTLAKKNEKDAEKRTGERNNLLDPAFKDHKMCAQFLKRRFASNIAVLGDWGITVNGNAISYPVDFVGKQEAVLALIDKHLTFAAGTSPLEGFLTDNAINLTTNRANAVTALTKHNERDQLERDAETATTDRDNFINPVMGHLKIIGNYLVAHFAKNPNKAGDWGYTVDTSPQGTKIRSGVIGFSSSKTLLNLANGGVLTNTCDHSLNAFKGKTTTGTPIVLAPGQNFPITKGFGTMTLQNPNNTIKGSYQGVFTA